MKRFNFLIILLVLIFFTINVLSADYQCTFKNQGQVNCNVASAADTFCYLAGPGPVANNPATAVSCTNNSPSGNGTIVCQLSNYSGNASSLNCSNSQYFLSGPSLVSSQTSQTQNCPYIDCSINQVSCASSSAYMKCVPDPSDPRCNKWEPTACVGGGSCFSSTTTQLATCMGVNPNTLTSENGVYFVIENKPVQQNQEIQKPENNQKEKFFGKDYDLFEEDLKQLIESFGILDSSRINIVDQKNNSTYGLIIKNSKIEQFSFREIENPNYRIIVNETAFDALVLAPDFKEEAKKQLKLGNIVVEGVGLIEFFNVFLLNIFLSFWNF